MSMRMFSGLMVFAVMILAFSSIGCKQPVKSDGTKQARADGTKETAKDDHGWWCEEHGVPEEICSLCSAEYAAKAKKEGDWCKIHDRAQSQCFRCDPSKYEKFEAMYIAHFNGKKPPRPPEEEFKK